MTPQSQARRWIRQTVDLPVKVGIYNDSDTILVPGRVTELSEGGMSLYAGMSLKPGDLLEVDSNCPFHKLSKAVVRNRTGYNFWRGICRNPPRIAELLRDLCELRFDRPSTASTPRPPIPLKLPLFFRHPFGPSNTLVLRQAASIGNHKHTHLFRQHIAHQKIHIPLSRVVHFTCTRHNRFPESTTKS